MARPKSPPRVNGPYPDREGTRFRVRIFDRGSRKDLYFRTQEAAQDCIALTRHRLSPGNRREIGELIDEYVDEKARSGRAKLETCEAQRVRIRWFLGGQLDADIKTLTAKQAAALYEELVRGKSAKSGAQLAAASQRHYLALAKGFFSWSVRRDFIKSSPFQAVQPVGRVRVGKQQLRIEEARRFVDEALRRFDDRGDVLSLGGAVALLMGLRAGEVLGRCARDLDRAGAILWIDSGKTRHARRFLDVPEVLKPRLRKLADGCDPGDPLFGKSRSGKPRTRQLLWQAVHRICDAAGVPRVCTHSLRGLWATLGVSAGAVSHAVAESLGHGSFAMTEKHYAQPEAISGARTARLVEFLNLGRADVETNAKQAAELLHKSLPCAVLDRLVALHGAAKK